MTRQKVPSYATHMVQASLLLTVFAVLWQIREWYRNKFEEISWKSLIAIFAGNVISAIYQFFIYRSTGHYMALLTHMVTIIICVTVMSLKLEAESPFFKNLTKKFRLQ